LVFTHNVLADVKVIGLLEVSHIGRELQSEKIFKSFRLTQKPFPLRLKVSVLLGEGHVAAPAIDRHCDDCLAKRATHPVKMGKTGGLFPGKVHDQHTSGAQTTPRVLIKLQVRQRGRNPIAIKRVN
jgi:hypothetical protein